MPAQNRVRSDQKMGPQCAGKPLHERSEHGPVRPVQARPRVGAAQDGDFVAEDEELDVLGGGRATRQDDQAEHLPEDQIEQPQRHVGIMSDQRSLLVNDPDRLLAPHKVRGWINYYGAFYRSMLYSLAARIDEHLVRWAMQKFKRLRGRPTRAWRWLDTVQRRQPTLFAHWHLLPSTTRRTVGAV